MSNQNPAERAAERITDRVAEGVGMTPPEEEQQAYQEIIEAEYAQQTAAAKAFKDACLAVLCDPEGTPCFHGSDGDRKVIADALTQAKEAGIE